MTGALVGSGLHGVARSPARRDGMIPLVVGVTGHRDPHPADVPAIQSQFLAFLSRLAELAPRSPIVVLTPLARGCDRIAARAALEFRRTHLGRSVEVLAPLPLPLDDYRADFAGDPADAAEFEELLAKVDGCYELPGPDGAVHSSASHVPVGPQRDLRYRRLGLYVALQSQVMVAMWDGVRSGKVGGTSEVVDFCLGRRPAGLDCGIPFRHGTPLLAPADETPVACIPTRRASGTEPADEVRRMGIDSCLREAGPAIRAVDDLNAQLTALVPPDRGSDALADPEEARLVAPWRCMTLRFMRLDALAARKKRAQMRGAKVIPMLAALGIVCFQWFGSVGLDRFRPVAWISLAAYVLFVAAAAMVWIAMTRRHRVEWMFVHARALAEAMRVQLAWTGSGVAGIAPDMYLARRSSDVRQLRVLLRAAVLESGIIAALGGMDRGADRGRAWVREQETYFDPASPGMRRRRDQVSFWSCVLVGLRLAVVLLSVSLLALAIPGMAGSGPLAGREPALCFLVACALATTVAVSYWQNVTLDREDLEVATRMRHVFANAARALREAPTDPGQVLRAVGKEALDEHAEWFANHRERLRMPDVG